MNRNYFVGIMEESGELKTSRGSFVLTPESMRPGHAVANRLTPPQELKGKRVLIGGSAVDEVIYEAKYLETLSELSYRLLDALLEKGSLTTDDLTQCLEVTPQEQSKKRCALVIGHKQSSPGAYNQNSKISEFDFNEDLAQRISRLCRDVDIQRIYRRTYKELPDDINAAHPDFIISLHCNAFNASVSGTETLYHHSSAKGKAMAQIMQQKLVDYLELPDRGIRARTTEDRGGYLLRYTQAPCVICEPFFLDNDSDLEKARSDLDALAAVYTDAIETIARQL